MTWLKKLRQYIDGLTPFDVEFIINQGLLVAAFLLFVVYLYESITHP